MAVAERTKPEDYVVSFAVGDSLDSGVSKPFEILRVGTFKRGDRTIEVSSEDLDKAIANFNRWQSLGQEVPIDYDHSFAEGRESPAAGWYASLKRKGESLWATVKWTAKAQEEIASGAYKFFSAEFSSAFMSEEGDEEGFTILAGALTNRPFLRGMTPVALSQEVEREMVSYALSRLDEQALSDNEIDIAEKRREVAEKNAKDDETKIETFKVEIDGEAKELNAEEIVALHQKAAKADEAEKAAKEKAAEAAASKSQVESLSTRIDTMEKDVKDRDFSELFTQAQREGRLDSKDETKTTWRETFDALGAEKTKALIEQVPAETIPVSSQGRAGKGDQEAAPEGFHSENFMLNQRVEAYMAEHPEADFDKALDFVSSQKVKAA